MEYLHYIIISLFIISICCYCLIPNDETNKNKNKNGNKKRNNKKNNKQWYNIHNNVDDANIFPLNIFESTKNKRKNYDKYNIVGKVCLKYIEQINGEDNFLTLKFAGNDLTNKSTYNLILLTYKNKQNEFKVHLQDHIYLKPLYENYGIYNPSMKDTLNKIIFATSDYNINKEQYLELEKTLEDENIYIIKASLWYNKGPSAYLHIDNKYKLYFDRGINKDIAKFVIL